MAGISVVIVLFVFMIAVVSSLTGIVLFILSKIQRRKSNSLKINLLLQIPLVVIISGTVILSAVRNAEKSEHFEAIENKVFVRRDEWKKGFDYNDKTLVPVNFLMNSDKSDLEYIGALAIENSYDYYPFYQLSNESGYELYYVLVSSFAGGEYYSRTFVDKNDYEAVMEYYCTADLSASVLWESAPENSELKYNWEKLNLDMHDKRSELIDLFHEVLDDVSDKKKTNTSIKGEGYDCFSYHFISDDSVFSTDLRVYTREDELILFVNEYKVESEIVEKYKEMLFSLVSETKAELEEKTNQMDKSIYFIILDIGINRKKAAQSSGFWKIGERKELNNEIVFWKSLIQNVRDEARIVDCTGEGF